MVTPTCQHCLIYSSIKNVSSDNLRSLSLFSCKYHPGYYLDIRSLMSGIDWSLPLIAVLIALLCHLLFLDLTGVYLD